jgi:hypothetical protein
VDVESYVNGELVEVESKLSGELVGLKCWSGQWKSRANVAVSGSGKLVEAERFCVEGKVCCLSCISTGTF